MSERSERTRQHGSLPTAKRRRSSVPGRETDWASHDWREPDERRDDQHQQLRHERADARPGRAHPTRRPERLPHRDRRVDRPDGRRRGHPDRRHPDGLHRRRDRQLRAGRPPAHRRHVDQPAAGAHQPRRPLADLRVPHPGVAGAPQGATALRCPVDARQHVGLPQLRLPRGLGREDARPDLERLHRAGVPRLLHAQGRSGLRGHGARGRPHQLLRHVRQGPGAHGPTPLRRRLLHDPHPGAGHLGHQADRLPLDLRAHLRRLPGREVPARPAGVPHEVRRLRAGGERLRAPRARLRGAQAPARPRHGARRRHRRLPRASSA